MYLKINKGQISSYTTPIVIMVIVSLFAFTFYNIANMQFELRETSQEFEKQTESLNLFRQAQDCFSTDKSFSLDQQVLENFDRNNDHISPDCADHSRYGVRYEVEQDYLSSMLTDTHLEDLQIAMLFDVSLSMFEDDMKHEYSGQPIQVNYGAAGSDGCPFQGCERHNHTRIVHAAGATATALTELQPDDEIGLITYSSEANVPHNLEPVEQSKDGLEDTIRNDLELESTTRIDLAMDEAIQLNWDDDKEQAIILMTDGKQQSQNPVGPQEENIKENVRQSMDNDREVHGVLFGDHTELEPREPDPDSMEEYLEAGIEGENVNCELDTDINGDGRCWYAESYEDLVQVYNSIQREVREPTTSVGGEHACAVPPERTIDLDLEVVFWYPGSEGHGENWSSYCDIRDNLEGNLTEEGVNIDTHVYSPSNTYWNEHGYWDTRDSEEGGTPMEIDSAKYNPEEDEGIPECVEEGDISRMGAGFEPSDDYNDFGLNSWATNADYIVENHDWDVNTDQRIVVIAGDHLPSGGEGEEDAFRTEGLNEEDIVDSLITSARINDVDIMTYPQVDDLEFTGEGEFEDGTEDIVHLMEKTSEETGGMTRPYSSGFNSIDISEHLIENYGSLVYEGETCQNVNYSFGDTEIGGDSITQSFDTAVKMENSHSTPGSLAVTLEEDPIHEITSAVRDISVFNPEIRSRVSLDRGIESREVDYSQNEITNYEIEQNEIMNLGNEGFIQLGVNGRTVFRESEKVNLDQISFEGYKGAAFQLILKAEDLDVTPEIDITYDGDNQRVKPNLELDSSTFYNFTEINIGEETTHEMKSICYTGTDRCVPVEEDIQDFELNSGTQTIEISYVDDGEVEVKSIG